MVKKLVTDVLSLNMSFCLQLFSKLLLKIITHSFSSSRIAKSQSKSKKVKKLYYLADIARWLVIVLRTFRQNISYQCYAILSSVVIVQYRLILSRILSNIVNDVAKYCPGFEQLDELRFSSGHSDIDTPCPMLSKINQ